jgi:hypothetical protein
MEVAVEVAAAEVFAARLTRQRLAYARKMAVRPEKHWWICL